MGRVERDREMARKRSRRVKLAKLRKRFAAAKSADEKQRLQDKARRISPMVVLEAKK